MEIVIRKWGGRPALRLSDSLVREARLSVGQRVSVTAYRDKIIITPLTTQDYTIEDLVAGINESNLHSEAQLGAPVGSELW